jgi:hypothetical protein
MDVIVFPYRKSRVRMTKNSSTIPQNHEYKTQTGHSKSAHRKTNKHFTFKVYNTKYSITIYHLKLLTVVLFPPLASYRKWVTDTGGKLLRVKMQRIASLMVNYSI